MRSGRRGEGTGRRCRSVFSVRPVVMGLLALLVVLQGLAVVGAPLASPHRDGGEASLLTSLRRAICANDEKDGAHPPPLERHAQCCIFCNTRGWGDAGLPTTGKIVETVRSQAIISIERYFAEAPRKPPPGWASSWSSQAPPSFS
jgi:hypothetical protein